MSLPEASMTFCKAMLLDWSPPISAFGKHLFYQLLLISLLRMGQSGGAEECFKSAKTALQHLPWYLNLLKLTFGQTIGIDVAKEARGENGLFQVKCFEGFRDYTEGHPAMAYEKLTLAKAMPQDLPFEYLMLSADLRRSASRSESNTGEEQFQLGCNHLRSGRHSDARLLFKHAAEAGHVKAKNMLGVLLCSKNGGDADIDQAFLLFSDAASLGLEAAVTNRDALKNARARGSAFLAKYSW